MEEAPLVVTAATGTLGPVVVKLAALLGGEYKLRRRTRSNINIIRSKLKHMHSQLWEIWEREDLDAASKELKMEALYLADDMDDAIDDFILTLKIQKNINGRSRSREPKAQPTPFQDFKNRAIDVSQKFRNKWKTKTTCSLFSRKSLISSPIKPTPRAPFVLADKSQLVGMDGPRDKLIKHLLGGEESAPVQLQIKMASIVGMAGMGKTTLARLVYEAIEEDKFTARAFVSLNPGGDMKEVLTSILQQVGAVLPSGACTEKRLIKAILNFLKDKRYIVIIDDIWHGGEWETIKKSLPRNKMGSGIVTTTRIDAIAEKWHDDFDTLIYKMDYEWDGPRKRWVYRIGGEDVAAGMVAKRDMVGEGFDCDHPVVKMCGCMPLALVCMFSALVKKREHEEQQGWHVRTSDVQDMIETQVKRNGIQNTPGFEPLVESLQLGYIHLPHHMLKTCFLYCSIYPEDRSMKRDHLVRRWIAEGLVYKEETAKGFFDELVSRRLIPLVKEAAKRYRYRMHPMMRNFLRWKLRKDNFITCSSDIRASYASRIRLLYIDADPMMQEDPMLEIDDCPVERGDPLSEINWSRIRSLVVFRGANRVCLKELECLRVLDLQFDHCLQNDHLKDICELFRLRHLFGLSGKGISEIPPEIGGLQHLETLEVRQTRITELPCEILNLQNLKNLDLKSNKDLQEVPREIVDLQHLENLCLSNTTIRELPSEIIRKLSRLKSLDLSRTGITELPNEIWNLQNLRTLNLGMTAITELPPDVANLQNLETLNLRLTDIENLPREISKLQHLESLNMFLTPVTKIPREIAGLKKLKNLIIHSDSVDALPWEVGQLSQLNGLPECVRQVWMKSDVVSSLGGEILRLHLSNNSGGQGLTVGTKHMQVPRWIKDHFNDLGFLDIRMCKLEEEDLKILREMPNLRSLRLNFEVVPRKAVAISAEGFARLYKFDIDSRVPRVTFQEGAMPMLTWLAITFQFYAGSPSKDPVGIKNLTSLNRITISCNEEWYRGDSACISATIDVLREEAREHNNNDLSFILNNQVEALKHPPNKSGDTLDACRSETGEIEEESSRRVEGIGSGISETEREQPSLTDILAEH